LQLAQAARREEVHAAHAVRGASAGLGEAHADVGLVLSLAQLGGDLAVDGEPHLLARVAAFNPRSLRLGAVDVDGQLGLGGVAVDAHVGGAGQFAQLAGEPLRLAREAGEVGPGEPHHDGEVVAQGPRWWAGR